MSNSDDARGNRHALTREQDTRSSCCIGILIMVLIIVLVVAVIL